MATNNQRGIEDALLSAVAWCVKKPKQALIGAAAMIILVGIVIPSLGVAIVNYLLSGFVVFVAAVWQLEVVRYLLMLAIGGWIFWTFFLSVKPRKGKKK